MTKVWELEMLLLLPAFILIKTSVGFLVVEQEISSNFKTLGLPGIFITIALIIFLIKIKLTFFVIYKGLFKLLNKSQ